MGEDGNLSRTIEVPHNKGKEEQIILETKSFEINCLRNQTLQKAYDLPWFALKCFTQILQNLISTFVIPSISLLLE